MQERLSLVVFSDLDGTLLDHDTYSWKPASPALDRLKSLGFPVILASSKTASEIRCLQSDMSLQDFPAIVENGAGLVEPHRALTDEQSEYVQLRRALDRLPLSLRKEFAGFGDMTDEKVAQLTGLDLEQAAMARARQFSEPGVWRGTEKDKAAFIEELAKLRISAREGGRFFTLSFGHTKKDRMKEIASRYAPCATLALGDAPNDLEMIESADFGVIVANPHRGALPRLSGEDGGSIGRTQLPGPEGWNIAVNDVLDRLATVNGGQTIG